MLWKIFLKPQAGFAKKYTTGKAVSILSRTLHKRKRVFYFNYVIIMAGQGKDKKKLFFSHKEKFETFFLKKISHFEIVIKIIVKKNSSHFLFNFPPTPTPFSILFFFNFCLLHRRKIHFFWREMILLRRFFSPVLFFRILLL